MDTLSNLIVMQRELDAMQKAVEKADKQALNRKEDAERLSRSPIKKLPKDPVIIEIERKLKAKQINKQIGCGYCNIEKTCKERDPKINKAKLGCKSFKHWSIK